MSTATPITYTLSNSGTYAISIRNISYVDNSNIQHHSDYTNFDFGGSDNTGNTSADQYNKNYVTGDYLEKQFVSDTHDRTVFYSTHTGATLTIQNSVGHTTSGIKIGWAAAGTGFTGLYVQQVISSTQLLLTGTPSGTITPGATITFSTSSKQIVLSDTDGLAADWQIIGNGYDIGDNAVIVSKLGDNATLNVSVLPTNPTVGNTMLFTSSTNYLTLNNTNNLQAGYTASGNGYDDTQYIVNVVDGNTVQMSDPPGSAPVNGYIKFTSNVLLYTIPVGESVTFSINYTNRTSNVGTNYPSAVTINAIQNSIPLVGNIKNYVNINSPPAPPPDFTGRGGNGGGAGFSGGTTVGTDGGIQGGWGAGGTDGFGGASSTGGVSGFA